MITLYDDEMSTACYRVQIALALLDLDYRSIALEEYSDGEPDALRPEVVLVDESSSPAAVLLDSSAALLYLCDRYDEPGRLLRRGCPDTLAQVLNWLSWSREMSDTAGAARRHESFAEPIADLAWAQRRAHHLMRGLDRHLWFGEAEGDEFLCGEFSLADAACFGDVVLSEEGGIDQQDYPAVRRWFDRVKRVPRFPLMPGIFPVSARPMS